MIDPQTGYDVTPSSIKAVIVRRSQVLLCLNDRDEWELPGGWPSREDVSLEATLRREILEETALDVQLGELLSAELLRTPNDGAVALIIYRASAVNDDAPTASSEHREVRFFGFDEVPLSTPEAYLRAIDQARRT
jgi:ADP-ribose pyrophosphatase YjhB (NUDIX family)